MFESIVNELETLPLAERIEFFREETSKGPLFVLQRVHRSSRLSAEYRVGSKAYVRELREEGERGLKKMLDVTRDQLDQELEKAEKRKALNPNTQSLWETS